MKPFSQADRLTKRGLPVFRVAPGAKKPAFIGWQQEATANATTVSTWRQSLVHWNIGVPTGSPSGLIVIDIDVKNRAPGLATWSGLIATYGPIPKTWEVETPSGGKHVYFRAPAAVPIRNSSGTRLGPGIDVRGNGGFVVAPPSQALAGNYRWISPPWSCPVASMPPWLVRLLTQPRQPSSTAPSQAPPRASTAVPRLRAEARWKLKPIPQGSRNDSLHRRGSALRRYGCGQVLIEQVLRDVNAKACAPPLLDREVAEVAMSCAGYRSEKDFSTVTERARELLMGVTV